MMLIADAKSRNFVNHDNDRSASTSTIQIYGDINLGSLIFRFALMPFLMFILVGLASMLYIVNFFWNKKREGETRSNHLKSDEIQTKVNKISLDLENLMNLYFVVFYGLYVGIYAALNLPINFNYLILLAMPKRKPFLPRVRILFNHIITSFVDVNWMLIISTYFYVLVKRLYSAGTRNNLFNDIFTQIQANRRKVKDK